MTNNKYYTSRELKKLGMNCGKDCFVHQTVIINNYEKN